MTENELSKALRVLIEKEVSEYRLPVKNGEPRSPRVLNGYLPPKRSGTDDDFPFVIVRPDSGETEADQVKVTVDVIIGCYTEEFDGHEYCLNVMQRIRTALMSLPNGILDSRYVLEFPIKWSNFAEQPYPFWQFDMETKWVYTPPQPIF